MCGIAGLVGFGDEIERAHLVSQMIRLLSHRGPDAHGIVEANGACLGHSRLKVIGISDGAQPMHNREWGATIVFNGEIYNYVELRERLRLKGYEFQTSSDTEVLLAAYREWSTECVHRLRGMFAFVINDHRKGLLFGARDRFGKKPLLYCVAGDSFAFASELKALTSLPFVERDLDLVSLAAYLEQLYVPDHRCIFSSIQKLEPGHSFVWRGGQLQKTCFWSPRLEVDNKLTYVEVLDRTENIFRDAVRIRLRSDVPLGVFLSGGVDSSLVALMAAGLVDRKLKTYTVRMAGLPDESAYAGRIANAIESEHTIIAIAGPQADDILGTGEAFDEPFSDSSAVPMWMMAREAKRHVTVVLSGDGADELFGGYGSYQHHVAGRPGGAVTGARSSGAMRSIRAALPVNVERWAQKAFHRVSPLMPSIAGSRAERDILERHTDSQLIHYEPRLGQLLRDEFRGQMGKGISEQRASVASKEAGLNRVFEYDIRNYLAGDILRKVDLTTMAWGLEARAPWLDSELADLALAIPPSMKVSKSETKRPLKDLLARRMGPSFVDRPKMGFGAPVAEWLSEPSTEALINDTLTVASPALSQWIQPVGVRSLVKRFREGRRYLAQPVWNLLMLEIWARKYL